MLLHEKIQEVTDPGIKAILRKLLALYGLFSIEKQHIPVLYQGSYATGELPVNLIQDAVLRLCSEIKEDAVSLVDVIAPPDFLLKSVLGASDGKVLFIASHYFCFLNRFYRYYPLLGVSAS